MTMTLEESVGRFSTRKTLRFEIEPVGPTAEGMDGFVGDDETRASHLYAVKDALAAEHFACARRVFSSLPDPLPSVPAILSAFRADPAYPALSGRSAQKVVKIIIDRYLYNRWPLPPPLRNLAPWQGLFIKWQWHLAERFKDIRHWAGRTKADVAAASPLLAPPRPHRSSRAFWYDHGPFRLMFDNHSCGMSWLREDFALARNFLVLAEDGAIYVGIVRRSATFNPFALPAPGPAERCFRLYVETAGQRPALQKVPQEPFARALAAGALMLFKLVGRGLRGGTNLNQLYLRALFSPENLARPAIHLDKACEFFARKGMDLPLDDKPAHFRQRYLDDRFFLSLHLTFNPELAALEARSRPFGNLVKGLKSHPGAPCLEVSPTAGGYLAGGEFLPAKEAANGALAGRLARWAVSGNGLVVFAPNMPRRLREAVAEKFAYVVVKGTPPTEPGGALRGYQLVDRLFTGDLAAARAEVARHRHEAERRTALEEARARLGGTDDARRARHEAEVRAAAARRELKAKIAGPEADEVFAAPIFRTGRQAFVFGYKTPDNARHERTCLADSRDEVFQKLRTVGVRPYRVAEAEAPVEAEAPAAASVPEPKLTLADRLRRLDDLKAQGLITAQEHKRQRARIIAEL